MGALAAALGEAGFVEARETVEEAEVYYADEAAWWASLWTHGARVPLERMRAEAVEHLKEECLPRVRALAGPRGVPERHMFVYVIGTRPGAPA
jgi:hypothetical protein